MPNLDRYNRQTLVEQVSDDGQKTLLASRVLVVGLGGLGCQVAAQLAGAGVGELIFVDHDDVAMTNLHRQILFREADIGRSKASVAKRECTAINSEITISAISDWLGSSSVKLLVSKVDLVIDAADNMATSYLLSDTCLARRVPLLSASVNKTFGYLAVFCGTLKSPAPSLRAAFPRLPRAHQSCDTVGITGPSVGIIASYQAQEAIKVLLGSEEQLLGKLLYLDLWQYQQHQVDFSNADEPKEKQIALISTKDLSPDDTIIDVRSEEEIINHPQPFKTSLNIPVNDIATMKSPETNSGRFVLACLSGQRALSGAQQLVDKGFSNVAVILPDGDEP